MIWLIYDDTGFKITFLTKKKFKVYIYSLNMAHNVF